MREVSFLMFFFSVVFVCVLYGIYLFEDFCEGIRLVCCLVEFNLLLDKNNINFDIFIF